MKICKICKAKFYVRPNHLLRGWGKYCSKSCQAEGQKTGKHVACHQCGKLVWRIPKELAHSKSGKSFCGKSCQTKWRNRQYIGEKHPNWKGGEYIYYRIMQRHNISPICKTCGMEDKRVLLIHHIDHNRKNNDISNLMWLCRNCHYITHQGKTI